MHTGSASIANQQQPATVCWNLLPEVALTLYCQILICNIVHGRQALRRCLLLICHLVYGCLLRCRLRVLHSRSETAFSCTAIPQTTCSCASIFCIPALASQLLVLVEFASFAAGGGCALERLSHVPVRSRVYQPAVASWVQSRISNARSLYARGFLSRPRRRGFRVACSTLGRCMLKSISAGGSVVGSESHFER